MEDQSAAITVKDAMRLTGYSLRQIDRFIEKGELEVVNHQPGHERKISRASINTFLDTRGSRPVDEVEILKQEQQEQKQATGEIARQVAVLKARVEELERLIKRIVANLETASRTPGGQRVRGSAPTGPDGAIMLVDFAREHGTTMGKLRGLVEHDPTLATVIDRPDALQKRHKWMILPAQMAPMLTALEKRGFAYTPCTSCPHDNHDQVQHPHEERGQVPLSL